MFPRTPTPKKLRMQVLTRDGYRCCACGRSSADVELHVDHIVPVSKGGQDTLSNLQTLCKDCNLGKSDALLADLAQEDETPHVPLPFQKFTLFYIDQMGQKLGLVDNLHLKELAEQGIIMPNTIIIIDDRYEGKAGLIPGLFHAGVFPTLRELPREFILRLVTK